MQEARERTPPVDKETGRLEAFSDGVFAIAITLLILNIEVPPLDEGTLAEAILKQWPAFLAYGVAFLTILIMWVNHHALFKHIRHIDRPFLIINGLLLMMITFVNYPTALLTRYLANEDGRTSAAIFFSATFVVIAILYNVLWRYAAHNGRLLGPNPNHAAVEAITRQYLFGPLVYGVALVLAFFSPPASLILNGVLAIYFGFTGREAPAAS
jgi:TMEM175 potassium channel family protein